MREGSRRENARAFTAERPFTVTVAPGRLAAGLRR